MADVRNLLNPQGSWASGTVYSGKLISGQTFDGPIVVSCPYVDYTDGKMYYYPLLTPSTAGVTPPTGGSGWIAKGATASSGAGTVTSASVVSTNGLAGTVANPTTTPAITLSTTVTGVIKGNGTALSAAVAGTDYSTGTSALATGILKSTTTSGALSIAATTGPGANIAMTGSAISWTPVITCSTPGDLSVSYAVQYGTYEQIGNLIIANFKITTSAFTHTTSSGQFIINGLPINANVDSPGSLSYQGITKASYSSFVPYVAGGVGTIFIAASGSGQTFGNTLITDFPSGGSLILNGTIIYLVA